MNYLSLLVPFAYLGILVTSLATFSSLYRARKAAKSSSLSPYFPPHAARNIYLSLLHLDGSSGDDEKKVVVPQSLLRAALLARCTENIHRIIHVRTRKAALGVLLKKGQVGEEIWLRLMRAEGELEGEVKECVEEANAYSPNWGTTIFQSANEMANNDVLKTRLEGLAATTQAEKEAWETKCAESRRELEGEGLVAPVAASAGAGGAGGGAAGSPAARMGASSDEDGILVDREKGLGSAGSTGEGSGGGGKKKKKGKK